MYLCVLKMLARLVFGHLTKVFTPLQVHAGSSRFAHPECNETRTWEQIAHTYKTAQELFFTGSLGPFAKDDFKVWACFKAHPCLSKVAAPHDAMCYKYHEVLENWHPWGLHSEIHMCKAGLAGQEDKVEARRAVGRLNEELVSDA